MKKFSSWRRLKGNGNKIFIVSFARDSKTIYRNLIYKFFTPALFRVGKHFSVCEHAQYLASLQNQFTLLNDLPLPSDNLSPIEILVLNNYKILHSTKSNNYNILAFLEALLIKHNKPFLKTSLKASKELQLFT